MGDRRLPKLHLGFVAICLSEQDCSPAGTVTVRAASSLSPAERRYRLLEVARRNLQNTLRILWFLKAHNFELYRLSANLIPLATHELTKDWRWWEEPSLRELGGRIGRAVGELGIRVSSHLPELCGLTSPRLVRWLEAYLAYHRRLFDLLELDERARILIHVGGGADKKRALAYADRTLGQLNPWALRRLVLENDDRVFALEDVLPLAEAHGVAVAFDWHHHRCNPGGATDGDELVELLLRAFSGWRDRPPKVHVSSPRSSKQPRAHADYVDPSFIEPLLAVLARLPVSEVDMMVEAKQKDLAALRLREQLRRYENALP